MAADGSSGLTLELDAAADQRVLGALRTGDHRRAAHLMVATYGPGVHRLCRSVASSADEADDITYSSFARAFSVLGDFRASGTPAAWMQDIAHTRCRELLTELASASSAGLSGAAVVEAADATNVAAWLSRQHGLARAAFGLLVHGATTAEIAADVGADIAECRRWLAVMLANAAGSVADSSDDGSGADDAGTRVEPSELYPRVVEALARHDFAMGEALVRRLEVLVAAL